MRDEGIGLEGIHYYLERINEDNSLEEIKIDWQSREIDYMDDIIYNNQLFTTTYGRESNIEQYDIKTGKWIKNIGEDVVDFTLLNDKLYALKNGDSRALECYDIESGKLISTIDIAVSYGCSMVTSEDEKGIYIFCDEGIYYLAEGEEIPELIIDGKRHTMSASSAYMREVYAHNGIFYIQYDLEDELVCKQYSYHKELPTVPEKTLTIFSLGRCESLQTAARIYADEHPEDLLQKISSAYQSKLFDEEGKIDDKQLTGLLENINTLAPRKEEMYDEDNKGTMYYQPYRIWQAMNHEIKATLEEVDGAIGLQYLLHTYAQLNHGTVASSIEGESKMVHLKQLIGINAKTDNLEEIQELMKIVYSKEIAEKRLGDFSVQQEVNESVILGEQMQSSAYSDESHPLKEWGISFGVTNEKGDMDIKDYNVWYSDEGKYYIEVLKNAQALMPMDEQVLDIIQKEAEGYFKGEISVDEVVEKIKQKVDVYLGEQN